VSLLNSKFSSSTTTAFLQTSGTSTCGSSWAKNSHVLNFCVTDPNYALGVRAGETVTVSDSVTFGGVHVNVLSVSKYVKNGQYRIVVDAPTQDTKTAADGYTLSFYNVGSYDTGHASSSLFLYLSARVYAGYSIGGAATGQRAASMQGGSPFDDSAMGIIAVNSFCLNALLQYHFDSLDPVTCTGCGMDSDPDISDDQQIGVYYGHGLPRILTLTGTVQSTGTNRDKITGIMFNGNPINAAFAGWKKGDHISCVLTGTSTSCGFSDDTIQGFLFDTSATPKAWDIHMNSNATQDGSVTLTNTGGGAPITATSPPTGKGHFLGAATGGGNIVIDGASGHPCNEVSSTAAAVNMKGRPALELLGGCATVMGLSSTQENDVIAGSGLASGSSLLGSYFDGSLYYENPASYALNTAGNTLTSGEGNGIRQCNPSYTGGCVQYTMNSSGAWRTLDSSGNPVQEFKDVSHALLAHTYQDGVAANASTNPPLLSAGITVVSSCSGTGCKVKLPAASAMLDVSASPVGSVCATAGAGNCGTGGSMTVINKTTGSFLVVPTGTDTINGSASLSLGAGASKTLLAGVGRRLHHQLRPKRHGAGSERPRRIYQLRPVRLRKGVQNQRAK
jgi:hypothetical protein